MATDTELFDWRIEQGETEALSIPVLDGDGDPLTVTGWPVDAAIKTCPGGRLLYAFPTALVETNGSTVVLNVPASVSSGWTFTRGWYRVQLTDPTSPPSDVATYRILQGQFLLDLN